MPSSVGVDVGGTFTDLVAREGSGRLRACKVPTTPANLARGVLNGLAAVRSTAGAPIPGASFEDLPRVCPGVVSGQIGRVQTYKKPLRHRHKSDMGWDRLLCRGT